MATIIIEEAPPPGSQLNSSNTVSVASAVPVIVTRRVESAGVSVQRPVPVPTGSVVLSASESVVPVVINVVGAARTQVPAPAPSPVASSRIPVHGVHFSTDESNPTDTLGYGTWVLLGAGNPLLIG